MSSITVGTNAVDITEVTGRGRPILQNLGPGIVYFDSQPGVTVATGIQLPVGAVFEFASSIARESGLSVVSDTAGTDVRVVAMGI